MCVKGPERDEYGRLLPGHTANPKGRRTSPVARLIEAAERCGATISITLPPKADEPAPVPPVVTR